MTTFLIIGAIGLALVVVTLVVGDLLDGFLHLDALDNDLFSISSLAAFIGAFGFGGAIGLGTIANMAAAIIVGLVVGSLAAWGAVSLTRRLKHEGASFRSDSMIGHTGRVITAIPEGGYGEITISVAGHVRKITAKADQPLASGTEVWVSAIASPTAVEVTPTADPRQLTP